MLRSNGNHPLARSPVRPRPLPAAAAITILMPQASLTKHNRSWNPEEPEYQTFSFELRSLAKMVHKQLGGTRSNDAKFDDGGVFGNQRNIPLFERGRFYDEYHARRNERLKPKKGDIEGYEKKPVAKRDLGVRVVESLKKRDGSKMDMQRKTATDVVAATRREARTPSYPLRSTSMEKNKKPSTPIPIMNVEKPVRVTERKFRRTRIT